MLFSHRLDQSFEIVQAQSLQVEASPMVLSNFWASRTVLEVRSLAFERLVARLGTRAVVDHVDLGAVRQ